MQPVGHEGGQVPVYVAYIFVYICTIVICRLYKFTLSAQAQVTLQLIQSFRFSVKIVNRAILAAIQW